MQGLIQHWHELSQRLGLIDSEPLLQELLQRYQEPRRVFHRLSHLQQVIEPLVTVEAPDWVQLAAWYHDAVYGPGRPWNERRSAALARRHLTAAGLAKEMTDRISGAILATASHRTEDPDIQLLLDADLSVLGCLPQEYAVYSQRLQREYSVLPVALYRRGRQEFLRRMLSRVQIFHHPWFHHQFEAQARENLSTELDQLGAMG